MGGLNVLLPTGHKVDPVKDDRAAGPGDQQPRVSLLLGTEGWWTR